MTWRNRTATKTSTTKDTKHSKSAVFVSFVRLSRRIYANGDDFQPQKCTKGTGIPRFVFFVPPVADNKRSPRPCVSARLFFFASPFSGFSCLFGGSDLLSGRTRRSAPTDGLGFCCAGYSVCFEVSYARVVPPVWRIVPSSRFPGERAR